MTDPSNLLPLSCTTVLDRSIVRVGRLSVRLQAVEEGGEIDALEQHGPIA